MEGRFEHIGPTLSRNVPGNYNLYLFESVKEYFGVCF